VQPLLRSPRSSRLHTECRLSSVSSSSRSDWYSRRRAVISSTRAVGAATSGMCSSATSAGGGGGVGGLERRGRQGVSCTAADGTDFMNLCKTACANVAARQRCASVISRVGGCQAKQELGRRAEGELPTGRWPEGPGGGGAWAAHRAPGGQPTPSRAAGPAAGRRRRPTPHNLCQWHLW
jgi:hypothetical protein